MKTFLYRPQSSFFRRALFQVHLWTGIVAGSYIFVVCVTGAALVFRIDMQRASYPHLFTPGVGVEVEPADILETLRTAYPGWRVSGVDAPTTARPTYLGYVARGDRFLTLLIDPVSARVLGELPERGFVRTVQQLHFDLLAGRTGRVVNGIGAVLLLAMCLTGSIIWWPGIGSWRRGFTVDFRRSWKRINWDLHSAIGFWLFLFMLMWGISGFYLGVPEPFSNFVDSISDPDAFLGDRPGDIVLSWLTRLHFGRWRDMPWLKAFWAVVGLVPALMFVTGVVMWWNRVMRRRPNVSVDEAVA